MTALADRGLPMAKCSACGRAGDIHDLTSLRLTGLCPRCRISDATPTRGLSIREEGPAISLPEWTLSLPAIMRPDGREAHAGNYVEVQESLLPPSQTPTRIGATGKAATATKSPECPRSVTSGNYTSTEE